jgi:hypothetical protein
MKKLKVQISSLSWGIFISFFLLCYHHGGATAKRPCLQLEDQGTELHALNLQRKYQEVASVSLL